MKRNGLKNYKPKGERVVERSALLEDGTGQ